MSAPQAHLETLPRSVQLLLALGLLALLAFPFAGQDFYTQMVTRMMILAIFAMSLDLLQGITGLVSLGHAAYFGLAGYVLAFMSPADAGANILTTLPLAVSGFGFGGLGDWFFCGAHPRHLLHHGHHGVCPNGVLTCSFDNKGLGGSDGIYVNVRPAGLGMDLENKLVLYYFTLVSMLLVYWFLRRLLWSPFGRTLERHSIE
jgi:branched-chain amino acid transport system permease protein